MWESKVRGERDEGSGSGRYLACVSQHSYELPSSSSSSSRLFPSLSEKSTLASGCATQGEVGPHLAVLWVTPSHTPRDHVVLGSQHTGTFFIHPDLKPSLSPQRPHFSPKPKLVPSSSRASASLGLSQACQAHSSPLGINCLQALFNSCSSHRQRCFCPEPEVELLYAGCRVQTGSQSKCPCLSSLSHLVLLEAISRDRYIVPRAGTLASSARDMGSPATLGVAPNDKTHSCLPLSSGCPLADGSGGKCLPTGQQVGVFLCLLMAPPWGAWLLRNVSVLPKAYNLHFGYTLGALCQISRSRKSLKPIQRWLMGQKRCSGAGERAWR